MWRESSSTCLLFIPKTWAQLVILLICFKACRSKVALSTSPSLRLLSTSLILQRRSSAKFKTPKVPTCVHFGLSMKTDMKSAAAVLSLPLWLIPCTVSTYSIQHFFLSVAEKFGSVPVTFVCMNDCSDSEFAQKVSAMDQGFAKQMFVSVVLNGNINKLTCRVPFVQL